MLFFANPHSRCAMLTRGPFRTREHPLEAGRNCSSSHVPQSSQACPPKSSFYEPLFLAKKKKECPLFSGEQWGSPCQQLRAQSRQGLLPWVEEKFTLSTRSLKESGNEKPPSQLYQQKISEGLYRGSLIVQVTPRYFLPTTLSRQGPLCSWSWPQTQTLPSHYRDYRHAPYHMALTPSQLT